MIGPLSLLADHHDVAVVAEATCRACRLNTGVRRADDEQSLLVGHRSQDYSGMRTTSPSRSSRIRIWHARRLHALRGAVTVSSIASSLSCAGLRRSTQAA